MKKFVVVFTWLYLGKYPLSAVYSVKARDKAAAVKKASTFAGKKLSLSTFEIFAEEITREKEMAIGEQWQKAFHDFECNIREEYQAILETWRAVCCNREDYTI